jgi:hypothetical protein
MVAAMLRKFEKSSTSTLEVTRFRITQFAYESALVYVFKYIFTNNTARRSSNIIGMYIVTHEGINSPVHLPSVRLSTVAAVIPEYFIVHQHHQSRLKCVPSSRSDVNSLNSQVLREISFKFGTTKPDERGGRPQPYLQSFTINFSCWAQEIHLFPSPRLWLMAVVIELASPPPIPVSLSSRISSVL